MTIQVDTREHLIPQIKDFLATSIIGPEVPEFSFKCLPIGDYLLENEGHTQIFERKSIQDFVGSYRELKPRLARMRLLDYDRTGLLLEGTYTIAQGMVWIYEGGELKSRMSYKTMCNFLTHQQELGTRMYRTLSLEETIWKLIHIHNYLPKLSEPTPALKCGSATELFVQLPGIGPKSVKKLKETYITPYDALLNLSGKSKKVLEKW
ncbi:MAG: ERCC4 domain-containing protein [Candidatus Delongbacteria bacterium]|nr:ERCC4 domain-containing protein [Candidatus Delongbacteria bacterium]